MITRELFEMCGAFDPTFFIYGDETDLCWRILRGGGEIAFAPASVVFHGFGGTKRFLPDRSRELLYREGTRNYVRMVAKNQHPRYLLRDVAGQLAAWTGVALFHALRFRLVEAALVGRGILDAVGELPALLRSRRTSPLPFVKVPDELKARFTVRYVLKVARAI
jgi:GT2 family glycosyltransferase